MRTRVGIRPLATGMAVLLAGLVCPGVSWGQQRLWGVDVSQYQGTIDWTAVKASGKSFAFIRAAHGNTASSTDTTFFQNITNAKNAGLYVSPYYYATPDTSAGDAVAEANYFLSVAGAYMTSGYLRPVLDLESGNTSFSTTALTQWVIDFSLTIYNAKQTLPIIYLNRSYARDELNSSITPLPLWLADPDPGNAQADQTVDAAPTYDPLGTGSFPNPYGQWGNPPGLKPWRFWQYYIPKSPYVQVPGINAPVDLDAYNLDAGPITNYLVPEPGMMGCVAGVVVMMATRRAGRVSRAAREGGV